MHARSQQREDDYLQTQRNRLLQSVGLPALSP